MLFEVDRMVIFATAQNFQGVISCYVPRRAFTAQVKKNLNLNFIVAWLTQGHDLEGLASNTAVTK